jgi:hypothetical protein
LNVQLIPIKPDTSKIPAEFEEVAKEIERADLSASPSVSPPSNLPEDKKKKFKVRFDEAY